MRDFLCNFIWSCENNVLYLRYKDIIKMAKKGEIKDRIGEKYTTNEGYEVEILEYFKWDNCTIRFKNGTIVKNVQYSNIKTGKIKNPYHPSVYGVGYKCSESYKMAQKEFKKEIKDKYNHYNSKLKEATKTKLDRRDRTEYIIKLEAKVELLKEMMKYVDKK